MSQQYSAQNVKTRTSILLFGSGWAAPVVLYFENPQEKYKEIQEILKTPVSGRVIEFDANGPVKKVCVLASQLTGVALQDEQYI